MEHKLKNTNGEDIGSIELDDSVFGVPMNKGLVHQVMVAHRANARKGTAHTKTRGEVSGGGRKPRPQKGSGKSRQGSIRSPQWRGGGTVFGPRVRSYKQQTPKKTMLFENLDCIQTECDTPLKNHAFSWISE